MLLIAAFLIIRSLSCADSHSVATGAPRTSELNIERLSSIVNELLNSTTDDLDPSLILQNFVKHPLLISNFTVPVASVQIQCFGVLVHGLNTVQIHEAMANISGQFLTFSLLVPFVQLTGQQRTSGYVSFVPVDTGGNLQLNVTDVAITGNASLKNSPQSLHVGAIHAQLEVGDVSLGMDGLSELTASLFNFVGKEIFDYTKHSMLDDFQQAMTRYANEEILGKIPVNLSRFEHDKQLIDSIVAQTCYMLVARSHDPQKLKPYQASVDRMFIQGEVLVTNATLSGLATLRRTGDVLVLYSNRTLILEANFGFANLSTTFAWTTKLLGIGPKGFAELTVSDTNMNMRLLLPLRRDAKLQVDHVEFSRIGHVVADIQI
ncbi:uncharacterized protein LOC111267406 isoform X2 [Varroa jacobsoni]|uniref:Uncharacterized protein n=1 Tax=Varroa destructor TaxID=109461 RepID=A0A7M7KV49_VARDE|nr:uncharacterized protein LOC111255086 isoform X2 [Varroa destructor]XP_022701378.1 uncharacterized protein LOC111267406 isoform X2 [Varroa jacobsoni]